MQSPLKRITVYDLETGGLDVNINSITEFAGVVIDTTNLEIIEKFTVMFRPYLDLTNREEEPKQEAKLIFKNLSEKDPETKVKTLHYKDKSITLKNLDLLINDIEDFYDCYLNEHDAFINYEEFLKLKDSQFSNIAQLFFDYVYRSEATEATHITTELLLKEGVPYAEGFSLIKDFFERNKVKNNKPILAGHNIKKFDNPFMEKLFEKNKHKFDLFINSFMIDSLDWVRLRWSDLPSFNLGTCANELEVTLKGAHRAIADTEANAEVLICLLKSMRGEGKVKEEKYERKKYNLNL